MKTDRQGIKYGTNPETGKYEFILPDKQLEFLEWLVSEDPNKGSERQYAAQRGMASETLRRWKKGMVFRQQWERRLAELNISPQKVQDVVDAMHQKAAAGDTRAAELYLRYIDRLKPPTVVVTDQSVRSLSDDELAAKLAAHVAAAKGAASE